MQSQLFRLFDLGAPSYFVLLVTGIWGLMAVRFTDLDSAAQVTLFVKISIAVLSAMFAAVQVARRGRRVLTIGGSLGLACALGAMFLGVLLDRLVSIWWRRRKRKQNDD